MRIYRSRTILAGLLALMALLGCTCNMNMNQQATTTMGSHSVTIKPGSSVVSSSEVTNGNSKTYEYTCGATNVRITDDKLIVNNKSYGALAPNAAIAIDSGVVSIDGQVVHGRALSQRERRQSSNYETTATLDGHRVTVRPGAMMQSTTSMMGKNTLTVGENTVVIENNRLTVNDVDYGMLSPSDIILIDNGVVKVNDRMRGAEESE